MDCVSVSVSMSVGIDVVNIFDVFDVDVFAFGSGGTVLLVAFALVSLGVFGQVVGAHETFAAFGARETLLARVRSQVALQFVGSREALAAEEPLAAERALAGVPPQMRLQVRCLTVDFAAARHVAQVLLLFVTQHVPCPSVLAIGASTAATATRR